MLISSSKDKFINKYNFQDNSSYCDIKFYTNERGLISFSFTFPHFQKPYLLFLILQALDDTDFMIFINFFLLVCCQSVSYMRVFLRVCAVIPALATF